MNKYLLIFLMLACANVFAEVNKWVDKNNQVHYSDQPPPSDAKTSTSGKSRSSRSTSDTEDSADSNAAAPASAPAAPKTIAEREAELKKTQKAKQEAADKAARKQAEEKAIQANCAAAQQNLRGLKEDIRIVEIDAKGERSYLDDNQRQQRIEKTQKDVSTYCK